MNRHRAFLLGEAPTQHVVAPVVAQVIIPAAISG